jgi:transposase
VDRNRSRSLALVADHYGEVIVEPFEFALTESGVQTLLVAVARAEAIRRAEVCRVGVECTGHYHRTLVSRLGAAAQVLDAARAALRLCKTERAVLGELLAADVALLITLEVELARAETALAELLPARPAAILTTLPGVGVIRASTYGAGIGDPSRFPNAGAAYRASGLVPTEYDSAGKKRRRGQHISREGSALLREAIIELGRGLTGHDDDFATYRRRLIDTEHKSSGIAAVAAGRRADHLAFAMLRTQQPYDPARWRDSVIAGRPTTTKTTKPHQNDPSRSLHPRPRNQAGPDNQLAPT